MVAGTKDFSGESLPYLILLMSLLRPDLQGYIKQDQTVPAIPVGGNYNPYNLTGVAFNNFPYGTSFNNLMSPKELSGYNYDPLSQYLNWQPNSSFDASAVAMILGDVTPGTRLPLDSESGYGSDEARSPLSAASCRSVSPPYSGDSPSFQGNIPEELGAAGYTPSTSSNLEDLLNFDSLEDYVDLESLPLMEATKGTVENPELSQFEFPNIKQEPKMSPPYPSSYTGKATTEEMSFPWDLDEGSKYFDPYSIDFTSATNQSLVPFNAQANLEMPFDVDSLVELDFPPELFTPQETVVDKPIYQQAPLGIRQNSGRNDSGFPLNEPSTSALTSTSERSTEIPPVNSAVQTTQNEGATSSRAALARPSTSSGVGKGKKSAAAKALFGAGSKALKSSASSIGYTDDEIVEMPVNTFTVLLEKLTESQAQYVRDVRRRGKNKEAARICRKRKLDVIDGLDGELMDLKRRKQKALDERKELQEETAELKRKISELESYVFSSMRDNNGQPLSSFEYSLFQGSDGAVFLGKNIESKQEKESKSS